MLIGTLLLAAAALTLVDGADFNAYQAKMEPIPNTNSTVLGTVIVITLGDGSSVLYGGVIHNLEPNLVAGTCTATNGCGLHIHSGNGCADTEAQGGHYFENMQVDPWIEARYSSDADGEALVGEILSIGSEDVEGRAMVGMLLCSE